MRSGHLGVGVSSSWSEQLWPKGRELLLRATLKVAADSRGASSSFSPADRKRGGNRNLLLKVVT